MAWNIHSGLGDYKYLVTPSKGVYDANGSMVYSTNDNDVALNWALANLTVGRTSQDRVVALGTFTINNTLLFYDYTWFDLYGRINLVANSNCDMIRNVDQATNGNAAVVIRGGLFYGNSGNQGGVGPYHGVNWRNPGTPLPLQSGEAPTWGGRYGLKLVDIGVDLVKGSAIHFDNSSGTGNYLVDRCTFRYGDYNTDENGSAIYLSNVSDSWFRGPGYCVGNYHSMFCNYGSSNHFSDWYFAGSGLNNGIVMTGCTRYLFSNVRTDSMKGHHWQLTGYDGVQKCQWDNCQCTTTGAILAADNTYDAWNLSGGAGGNCIDNIWTNCLIAEWGTTTRHFRYGIHETNSNQNYNTFVGINGRSPACGTGAIRRLGANSDYGHVQGTVIII